MQPGRSFSRRTVLRLAAAITAVAAVAAGFLVTPNPWLLRHAHSGSSVLALEESDGSGSDDSALDGSGSAGSGQNGSGSAGSGGDGSWGAGSGSGDSGSGNGGSGGGWSGNDGSGGAWSGNGGSGGGWPGGTGSGDGGGWSGGGGSGDGGTGGGWWGSSGSDGSGYGGGYGGGGYGGGSGYGGGGYGGGGYGGGGYGGGCRYPSQILDLKSWKLTLPTGSAGSPKEIVQPALATFASTPWFQPTSDCAAVVFRSAVDGVTTKGSSYPRSELREMSDGGSDAAWSSASGTHTLTVTESFNRLPQGKPQLVGAQIHDDSDDISVFRLEGSNLYVTDGDNPHFKLVTSDYALGTRYQARYVVSDGTVKAYYNGQLQATLSKSFSNAYFKAGAYTQANCEKVSPCDSDNYGETMIYNLEVSHG
ncbi:polysaccharide lyase family 7 protein [Pseudonocardia sp. Cha107L01]|uniref:polysaccharide lyase family 7 protein n=1 Tax=Pseudonocardia sp. Cha107L01 TaxID=3457576 RepID=UPI00403E64EF